MKRTIGLWLVRVGSRMSGNHRTISPVNVHFHVNTTSAQQSIEDIRRGLLRLKVRQGQSVGL